MNRPRASGLTQSVRDRLRRYAESIGRRYDLVLELYVVERFLHRLGSSPLKDRFVLKGAQLLRHWAGEKTRPTRDVDLYAPSDVEDAQLQYELAEILRTEVEDDAVEFDLESLTLDQIRRGSNIVGFRAKLDAYLARSRVRFQIDTGLGDSVFPEPEHLLVDGLLGMPVAEVLAYTPYSSIAEKLEAIVILGLSNTRMKDYYDLLKLSSVLRFDGSILVESIRRTFARRSTPIPDRIPEGLTEEFSRGEFSPVQWRAFRRKAKLEDVPADFGAVVGRAAEFLAPALEAARVGADPPGTWPPGGPWMHDESGPS